MALLSGSTAAALDAQRGQERGGQCVRTQVPGLQLLGSPGRRDQMRGRRQAMRTFKHRIRQLTSRSGGRSMEDVVERLRAYVLGWKAYFRLAQTPKVWRELDEWLRHRLRAIQLKHWKRGTTMYRELVALGASPMLRAGGGQRRAGGATAACASMPC